MQVNENRLDTILQNFVESFNDCACCPLTFDCERDNEGIDCYECAELLKKWLMGGVIPYFFQLVALGHGDQNFSLIRTCKFFSAQVRFKCPN